MKKRKRTYKRLTKTILLLLLVIITFLICKNIRRGSKNTFDEIHQMENKEILLNGENYEIDIIYPYFYIENIDNIIMNYLDNLMLKTKEESSLNRLEASYEIFNIDDNKYIVFNITSTLDNDNLYKTFLVNEKEKKINDYDNIFDTVGLKEKILKYFNKKYSTNLYNKVKKMELNDMNLLINNDKLIIYFYELKTSSISYVPRVELSKNDIKDYLKTEIDIEKEYIFKTINYDKVIALTFDDGPSDNTNDILDVLKEYNAHATFFSLGNRMKTYSKVLNRELKEGHEVDSHTYSHKNLTEISKNNILSEINSTNIAFNSTTGKKIYLVRPPYGAYDNNVLNTVNYPLILWNIDTQDWYNRDAKKTAKKAIRKAFDGGIVLMHDLYSSNIEALKIILPELESKGYRFVTINEMADYFDVTLKSGKAYRYIE